MVSEDAAFIKVIRGLVMYNVLHCLLAYRSECDLAVISGVSFVSFLEYRRYQSMFPVYCYSDGK